MSSNVQLVVWLAIIITFSLLLILFSPAVFFVFSLCLLFVMVFYLNPKVGLLFLILIRPSLDYFTSYPVLIIEKTALNLSSLLAILSVIFGIFIGYKNRETLKKLPLSGPIFFFLALLFFSIFYSAYSKESLAEIVRLTSVFSLYFLGFCLIKNKKDLHQLITVIASSFIVPAILAVSQYWRGAGMTIVTEEIYNRIHGTFAHPNLFAYYLVFVLSLILFMIVKKSPNFQNTPFFAAIFLFLVALLALSFTRGAWLAFLIMIFIAGALRYREFLLASAFVFVFVYFAVEPIRLRIDNLITSDPTSSVQWRLELWKDIDEYAKESPLVGHGAGTAKELILDKRGARFGSSDPHNDYLKLWLENGWLGLFSYIAVIATLLFNLARNFWLAKDDYWKDLFLIVMSFSASLFVMSFADNILRNTALMWSFWTLIGALFAVSQQKRLLSQT